MTVEFDFGLPCKVGQNHRHHAFCFGGKYAPLCRPLFSRAEPLFQALSEFIQEYATRATAVEQASQYAWWFVVVPAWNFDDNFW